MEHLLPAGIQSSIRVPYFHPPGENGPADEEYHELFSTVIAYQTGKARHNAATIEDQVEVWMAHCQGLKLLHLCHHLQSVFFLRQLHFILGDEVRIQDFTVPGRDGTVYLSTEALPGWLAQWQKNVTQLRRVSTSEEAAKLSQAIYHVLEQSAQILRHLAWFLDFTYTNLSHAMKPNMQPRTDEPLGMAHFSCVLLHQALSQACGRVLGFEIRAGNALSLRSDLPWLKRRMQIEGWCPYTVWKLYTVSDIEELVYGYAVGTVRTQQSHDNCSEQVCVANSEVHPDAPRHVGGVGCDDCVQVYTPLDDMLAIMEKGDVPVLRIETDDGYKLSLSTRRSISSNKYVAISHTWVDGLGSAATNSIAQCQLVRLANRLGQLESTESCRELCFWMDTLCIPVGLQYQDVRALQIEQMHQIYKSAYAVMVMDADLLTVAENTTVEELSMRLYMSAWSSRLWTYQEGSLNRRVLIMANDGIIDLDRMILEALSRDQKTDALAHNLTDQMLRATVYGLGRPQHDSSPAPELGEEEQQAFFAHLDEIRDESDQNAQQCLQAMRDRTTSRPDDEAVIIGSSLGLDVQPILRAPSEQRMMALIKAMKHVPANLVFTTGPRCTELGFRWAPKSILRSKGAYVAPIVSDLVPVDMEQMANDGRITRLMCSLEPGGQGLLSFYPAIRLHTLFSPERLPHHRVLAFSMLGKPYAFHGLDADFDNAGLNGERTHEIITMLQAGHRLAIVVPEFDLAHRLYIGALVEILSVGKPLREAGALPQGATKSRLVMLVAFEAGVDEEVGEALRGQRSSESHGQREDAIPTTSKESYVADWMIPRYWLID